MSKIYAMMRYKIYQKLKLRMKGKRNIEPSKEDIVKILKKLRPEGIVSDVFELFKINSFLDAQLELRKAEQLYTQEDEAFQNYLNCLKEAHERFMGYIF